MNELAVREDGTNEYDEAVEDFWRDLPAVDERQNGSNNVDGHEPARDIDEEIKVGKKRKPIAKLDAERLLSEKGIPELRRRSAKRVKLLGKGHEYADMSQLLSMYQIWLDDLYPRAKFRDALSLVEKEGHSKRLQVMRRAWVESTKAGQRRGNEEEVEADDVGEDNAQGLPHTNATSTEERGRSSNNFDALPWETRQSQEPRIYVPESGPGDIPEEDELDALLAEEPTDPPVTSQWQPAPRAPFEEEFDDLDELLADEPGAMHSPRHDQKNARGGAE